MKFYKQKLLSDAQLRKLSEHKYSCTSNSICDALLQGWWNWLVSKVPLWLAPNLITIVGLLVNVVTTLILIWYSPDAKQEPPAWTCALCALGLFVYQSLDAIDGKQARRTGSANPLGELFDHGCDSISTVFVALAACTSVQLGYYPGWMFFQCFSAMTLFYCAHWQTYVSGTLRFGQVDVTEAQNTIIILQLISAIFGPSIWTTKFFGDSIPLWYSIPILTCICGVWSLSNMLVVIFTGGVGKNGSTVAVVGFPLNHFVCWILSAGYTKNFVVFLGAIKAGGCGKNGSTVAGTSVLSPIIPFSAVLLPAFIIYKKSVDHIYEEHPALYILAFGMVAAKVTNRLVVAHMTKSEMDYMDWSLLGPAMLFLNQYFNVFIPEYYVLWLCLIWVTFDLYRYCYQICHEICDHLHIELFRIPYLGGSQQQQRTTRGQFQPQSTTNTISTEKNGMNAKSKKSRNKYH
nr:choline/ethanolaminephosphotransferase 1 isoform X4 [Onthophagus taurus]